MDDFRDLMYDLIIESLVDKLDNYEITMEDAEIFSEAAYDELYYEGSKRDNLILAGTTVGSAAIITGLLALGSKLRKKAMREHYRNKDLVPQLDNSIENLKRLKDEYKQAKSKEEQNRIKQEIKREKLVLKQIEQEMDDNLMKSDVLRTQAYGKY